MSRRNAAREDAITPEQAMQMPIETRLLKALEGRRAEMLQEGMQFNRRRMAYAGPNDYLVMLRRWYKVGFEDGSK